MSSLLSLPYFGNYWSSSSMKKSLLFIGMIFTGLVMLLSNPAVGNVQQHVDIKKEYHHTTKVNSSPSPCAPVKNPQENSHYFRATLSLSIQTLASIIRFYQESLCSFKSYLIGSSLELNKLPKRSTAHTFFITLFRVIISTHAP